MAVFADRIGLYDSLSAAVPWRGERAFAHDRGKVLVHAGLMLAGGGESCADIETVAAGGDRPLLTEVCSDTTLWRTLNQDLTPSVVDAVWAAVAAVRAKVWARSSATTGTDPVVLDIDASLVEIHSENKEGSAPHFKRGFGFHPMFCLRTPPAKRSPRCCGPATPQPTTSPTRDRLGPGHRPAAGRHRRRAPPRRRP